MEKSVLRVFFQSISQKSIVSAENFLSFMTFSFMGKNCNLLYSTPNSHSSLFMH